LPDSTKELNPLGTGADATTRYVWDAKWDAPTTVTSPTLRVSQAQYDSTTGDLQWQQPGTNSARRTQYGYFSATGLLQSTTPPSPLGTTTYEYDTWGNPSAIVSPSGLRSTVVHDAVGRDSLVKTPIDSLPSSSQARIQAYQYDAMSRVRVAVDSALASSGGSTWHVVRLITDYDDEGKATSVTRRMTPDHTPVALGDIVTSVEYDAAGRVTRQYDPNKAGAQTTWRYAASGASVTATSPTGTDSVQFDILGRPIHRVITGLGGAPTNDEQVFGYDVLGNLTLANNRFAHVNRGYFPNGALKADTLRIANADLTIDSTAHRYVVGYTYDLDGRRLTLARPSQFTALGLFDTTSYDYDDVGALAHVIDPHLGTFTYTTGNAGTLDQFLRPDGTKETYSYRSNGQPLTRAETNTPGTVAYHSDLFRFDGRGKALATQSTTLGTGFTSSYAYAGLGAVLSASGPTPSSQAEVYTRDPLGNVLTRLVLASTWTGDFASQYDGHSTRVTSITGAPAAQTTSSVTPVYDLAGNVIRRDEEVHMPADCAPQIICDPPQPDVMAWSTMLNTYAGDGRLVRSTLTTSNDQFAQLTEEVPVAPYAAMGRGVDETYRSDALGRRVWRRAVREPFCLDVDVTALPICLSFVERTVYDGDQVLYEIRQPGADTTLAATLESDGAPDNGLENHYGIVAYLYGGGIDQPLALQRLRASAPTTLLLHRDWQGTVDFSTLATGEVYDCGRPGAIATCENILWPGADLSVGFQRPTSNVGQAGWWGTLVQGNPNATGTVDMRARQFDPKLGVFLQEDPIGIRGGLNTYGFGGGDAVNMRDPSGLCPENFIENPDSRGNGKTWCVPIAVLDPVIITAPSPFFEAMRGLEGILNGVGNITGLNDLGGGAGDIGNGHVAGGLFKMAMAMPVLGPEERGVRLAEQVLFKSAHGARHLAGTGLSRMAVEEAVRGNILGRAAGSHWGWVQVGEQWVQYRAYELEPGIFNVGTYFPVAGLFKR
jgi:RHS repeat-associated protein